MRCAVYDNTNNTPAIATHCMHDEHAKKASGCWKKRTAGGRRSCWAVRRRRRAQEASSDQAWLFNEAEALAQASRCAPVSVMIPTHKHGKSGCKRSCVRPSWVMVIVQEFSDEQEICASDGAQLNRIGEEISEQLDESIAVKL